MRRIFNIIMLWLLAMLVLSPWSAAAIAQGSAPAPLFKPEELDQLVAPIALYPDSLLAQVLMASTYPLEIVSAARWVKANPKLKDQALDDALQTQTWDPSVKSLAVFPEVLTMMNEKLDWTQKLGDAFLAQQTEVMDAIQRLRSKAQAQGNLKTTQEQKVIVEPMPGQPDYAGAGSRRRAAGREPDHDHQDRAGQPASGLRPHLQPHGRLWGLAISRLSAVFLLSPWICRGDLAFFVRGRRGGGLRTVGKLQLGAWGCQHQRQQL